MVRWCSEDNSIWVQYNDEAIYIKEDFDRYIATQSFYLLPYFFLRKGAVVDFSEQEQLIVYTPCGYAPIDDVCSNDVKTFLKAIKDGKLKFYKTKKELLQLQK